MSPIKLLKGILALCFLLGLFILQANIDTDTDYTLSIIKEANETYNKRFQIEEN